MHIALMLLQHRLGPGHVPSDGEPQHTTPSVPHELVPEPEPEPDPHMPFMQDEGGTSVVQSVQVPPPVPQA